MAKQSKGQKDTIDRVLHEFKEGDLDFAGGHKVTSRKQAIAIALSEAGSSDRQSPEENRRRYHRTKQAERGGDVGQARDGPTRAELYEKAKQQDIPGRSRMNKAELAKAVG